MPYLLRVSRVTGKRSRWRIRRAQQRTGGGPAGTPRAPGALRSLGACARVGAHLLRPRGPPPGPDPATCPASPRDLRGRAVGGSPLPLGAHLQEGSLHPLSARIRHDQIHLHFGFALTVDTSKSHCRLACHCLSPGHILKVPEMPILCSCGSLFPKRLTVSVILGEPSGTSGLVPEFH